VANVTIRVRPAPLPLFSALANRTFVPVGGGDRVAAVHIDVANLGNTPLELAVDLRVADSANATDANAFEIDYDDAIAGPGGPGGPAASNGSVLVTFHPPAAWESATARVGLRAHAAGQPDAEAPPVAVEILFLHVRPQPSGAPAFLPVVLVLLAAAFTLRRRPGQRPR
jgi:hypothetical protein